MGMVGCRGEGVPGWGGSNGVGVGGGGLSIARRAQAVPQVVLTQQHNTPEPSIHPNPKPTPNSC